MVTGRLMGMRLLAGLVLSLLMLAGSANSAFATNVTPSSVNGVQHFLDCLNAIIHDGTAHHQFCGPGLALPPGQLVPTFSSPSTVTDCPVGDLGPAGAKIDVSCLSCMPCTNSADAADRRPTFAVIRVAAIEESLDQIAAPATAKTLNFACCPPNNG